MDNRTLKVYDDQAATYVKTWLEQPAPSEIYRRIEKYFKMGRRTADIGAGSGRDVDWLNQNGYPTVGYDASDGLLEEARTRYPDFDFLRATLPSLREIAGAAYQQVLCETVLMHLPESEHEESVKNLLRILESGGILLLSWRMPESNPEGRDPAGRLYTKVDFEKLFGKPEGRFQILEHQKITSPSSGKEIEEIALKKR